MKNSVDKVHEMIAKAADAKTAADAMHWTQAACNAANALAALKANSDE